MLRHLKTKKFLLVLAVSIVAGFISAKFLAQGNPLVALPWGVLAFVAAFFAKSKREALALGGSVGFVASYAYLWFDNTAKLTLAKIITLTFLIVLPALFGFLCGLLCSWLGWATRTHIFKRK